MSPFVGIATALTRRLGFRFPVASRPQRRRHRFNHANRRLGLDLARAPSRRHISIWLIPGWVLGGVAAALIIAHLRVELIQQGYQRASNVKRTHQLEEEQQNLAARVRELRDPARLAALAKEMGLTRPERVISLAPPSEAKAMAAQRPAPSLESRP